MYLIIFYRNESRWNLARNLVEIYKKIFISFSHLMEFNPIKNIVRLTNYWKCQKNISINRLDLFYLNDISINLHNLPFLGHFYHSSLLKWKMWIWVQRWTTNRTSRSSILNEIVSKGPKMAKHHLFRFVWIKYEWKGTVRKSCNSFCNFMYFYQQFLISLQRNENTKREVKETSTIEMAVPKNTMNET